MHAPLKFAAIRLAAAAAFTLAALLASQAGAADTYTLTIKDHKFEPDTLKVPAGEEFELTVVNSDSTAEEFESEDLHIEKVIDGGQTVTIPVGQLEAGSYAFVGERHEDTAHGTLTAE